MCKDDGNKSEVLTTTSQHSMNPQT